VSRSHSINKYRALFGVMTSMLVLTGATHLSAETLESALSRAYGNNPTLNSQRASVRATDENVARAKSGYRPQVNASADAGRSWTDFNSPGGGSTNRNLNPRGVGIEVNQSIFNGNRTENGVRQAESSVFGARENLNNNEQNVLFDSATAYMNVLRDTAILYLQRNNVEVIDE
jgi:outer membrane protein